MDFNDNLSNFFVCNHSKDLFFIFNFYIYRHGANVRANGYENETAVHLAASNGHHDAIRILINHGAEVDAVDENQCTPLMFAGMYVY